MITFDPHRELSEARKLNYDGAVIKVGGNFPESTLISIVPGKRTDIEQMSRYIQFIECVGRIAACSDEKLYGSVPAWR